MTLAYISLLVFVGIGRLAELGISRRNQRQLEKQGVRKIPEPHFRWMVLLHGGVLVCAGAEVLFLHRPLISALAIFLTRHCFSQPRSGHFPVAFNCGV